MTASHDTMNLKNKTILVLSPQAWGTMYVSKHHYAVELAKRGNEVYFLNPPSEGHTSDRRVAVTPLPDAEGLFLVTHRLYFPYNLKFHAPGLFHRLMGPQIAAIIRALGKPPDIVWSFDLNNTYPLTSFGKNCFKIFHPVDEPLNKAALTAGKGADMVFSVTREILDKYRTLDVPRHFINHGVAGVFLPTAADQLARGLDPVDDRAREGIKVGFSGNLLRKDIDRAALLAIIRAHPSVSFHCWGSYSSRQANMGGDGDTDTLSFIDDLRSCANVTLHGPVPSTQLARAIHAMDAFLICYDVKKDQSGGTNYHKVMEYLCTGNVIIANNITTYHDHPGLIQMIENRESNAELPPLFARVIGNLAEYNSDTLRSRRMDFAAANTYARQIEKIEKLITSVYELER